MPPSLGHSLPAGFLVAQIVTNLPAVWDTWARSLGWEYPWEKGMATHSSILAWRIPGTEESGGLQSMGLQRFRHDWTTNPHTPLPAVPSPPSPDETLGCKHLSAENHVFITFIYPKPYIVFALSEYSINMHSLPFSLRRIHQVSFGLVSPFRSLVASTYPSTGHTHVFQCCPLLPAHACQPSFNLLPSSSLHTQRSTHSTGSGLGSQGSVIIGRPDGCC